MVVGRQVIELTFTNLMGATGIKLFVQQHYYRSEKVMHFVMPLIKVVVEEEEEE